MSVEALTWAFKQHPGSPSAKLVLVAIANHADEHARAWPSREVLAAYSDQSADTVSRRLRELEADGFIVREERLRADGGRTSDLIRLVIDRPQSTPPSAICGGPPLQSAEAPPLQSAEAPSAPVHRPPPQLCGGIEPSLNHQINTPQPPEGQGRALSDGNEEGQGNALPEVEGTQLDALVEAFAGEPSVVVSRPEAVRAWSRLSSSDQAHALARLPRYLDHCRRHKNKVRSPASYLRGRVWEHFDVAPARPVAVVRPEADAVMRAVEWALASGADRSRWVFVAQGTPEWDAWCAAFRHAGRVAPGAGRVFADDGQGGFAHRVGRSFPLRVPPTLHGPPDSQAAG